MKICPFCAEEIWGAAISCTHCKRELATKDTIPLRASDLHGASARCLVERRTLCPSCGGRPKWLTKVNLGEESVVQNWWCPECSALIESTPQLVPIAYITDYYVDEAAKCQSESVKFTRSVKLTLVVGSHAM